VQGASAAILEGRTSAAHVAGSDSTTEEFVEVSEGGGS
jgi:hypothetical protein